MPSPELGAGMRRREFITLIGGVAAAWPLAARGQPTKRIPKVGVLWHAGSAEQEARRRSRLVSAKTVT
jgi:putative ABC transport system substrate-binding protein